MADKRNPFADRLTAYKPTLRDQARNIFANGGYEARRFAANVFGSPGNMGLADWTPLGTAFGLEEAGRKITTPGQRLSGGADIALAMVPIPAAAKGAKKLAAARKAKPKGFTAYHGSPHTFDQFSLDKIGTGEGAQAFGHGLYFAENEGVARSYRFMNAPAGQGPGPANLASEALARAKRLGFDGDDARRFAMDELQHATRTPQARPAQDYYDAINNFDALTGGKGAAGAMYQVRINADPEDFMDWDKPLSQQPRTVRAAVEPRLDQLRAAGANIPADPSGEHLYRAMHPQGGVDATDWSKGPATQASDRLKDAGIPGIRYLDQGSRDAGEGTRNFVVFDPRIIDIMKRYGVAAPVAAAILSGQMAPPKEPGT